MGAAEDLKSYVAKIVASAPPLSDEQITRVALLLRDGGTSAVVARVRPEVAALRDAEEGLAKARKHFKDALSGCHGCGLSREVHALQQHAGMGYHDFEDLTPDGALAVAKAHKKKIAAAGLAVTKAKSMA